MSEPNSLEFMKSLHVELGEKSCLSLYPAELETRIGEKRKREHCQVPLSDGAYADVSVDVELERIDMVSVRAPWLSGFPALPKPIQTIVMSSLFLAAEQNVLAGHGKIVDMN